MRSGKKPPNVRHSLGGTKPKERTLNDHRRPSWAAGSPPPHILAWEGVTRERGWGYGLRAALTTSRARMARIGQLRDLAHISKPA